MHGLDRLADVLRGEPAGEHHAALVRAAPAQCVGVLLRPRQVEHARDLLAVAQQDGVAGAMAVLARVELDEVGAVVLASPT